MTSHDRIYEYLQNQVIFGNSLYDYTKAIILFTITLVILEILRIIVSRKLKQDQEIQTNQFSQIATRTIRNYLSFSLSVIISLYVASRSLKYSIFISTLIDLLVFGLISWLLLRLCLKILDAVIEYRQSIDSMNTHILEFFRVIIRAVLIIIVLLWFLTNLGVDVTSFLASLGILSLAIAFALKEIFADVFASIVIFIDRPFEIGDSIKVENDSGVVEQIGLRSSKIRSADGHLIVASNRELTNKKIHNLKRMNTRRVNVTIQVHQDTPKTHLEKIPRIIEELVNSNQKLIFDKVNLNKIGDFTFDYELVYFVKSRDIKTHKESMHVLLINLLEYFNKEEILLPYPTQTIIIEE